MKNKQHQPEVIYRPDLQPRAQRTLFQLITACAWTCWAYLLLPLISLLIWYLGFDYLSGYLVNSQTNPLPPIYFYGLFIVTSIMVIFIWSKYNTWRYAKKVRRRNARAVTPDMICERFLIDRDVLDQLRIGKIVEITVDDRELIQGAHIRQSAAA